MNLLSKVEANEESKRQFIGSLPVDISPLEAAVRDAKEASESVKERFAAKVLKVTKDA